MQPWSFYFRRKKSKTEKERETEGGSKFTESRTNLDY